MASRKRWVGRWEDDHRHIEDKKKCRKVLPRTLKLSAVISTNSCLRAGWAEGGIQKVFASQPLSLSLPFTKWKSWISSFFATLLSLSISPFSVEKGTFVTHLLYAGEENGIGGKKWMKRSQGEKSAGVHYPSRARERNEPSATLCRNDLSQFFGVWVWEKIRRPSSSMVPSSWSIAYAWSGLLGQSLASGHLTNPSNGFTLF